MKEALTRDLPLSYLEQFGELAKFYITSLQYLK